MRFNNLFIIIIFSFLISRNLEVNFNSEENWLMGRGWLGGEVFNNSISIGSGFIGESLLNEFNVVDVNIYLSQNEDSISNAWVYSSIDTGSVIGFGSFPGSAWDLSDANNPRRLNIIFFEENIGNLIWNPEGLSDGDREYLLIMKSGASLTNSEKKMP